MIAIEATIDGLVVRTPSGALTIAHYATGMAVAELLRDDGWRFTSDLSSIVCVSLSLIPGRLQLLRPDLAAIGLHYETSRLLGLRLRADGWARPSREAVDHAVALMRRLRVTSKSATRMRLARGIRIKSHIPPAPADAAARAAWLERETFVASTISEDSLPSHDHAGHLADLRAAYPDGPPWRAVKDEARSVPLRFSPRVAGAGGSPSQMCAEA